MTTHVTGNGDETYPRLIPSAMLKSSFSKPDGDKANHDAKISIVSLGLSAYAL